LIINIPYSVGLATGIIVFFNHFTRKKITDDPTPIEVEMALYETEVNETVLDVLNTRANELTSAKSGSADRNEGHHGNS
jgi:stage V sporulation protein AA